MDPDAVTETLENSEASELPEDPRRPGPDFICVGAQKGGTRWLFDQLEQHRDFWMAPVKELHYLNHDLDIELAQRLLKPIRAGGERSRELSERKNRREFNDVDRAWLRYYLKLEDKRYSLERYAKLFAFKGDKLSGDVSPPYSMLSREQALPVRERFPNAKIIYLARDPIDRIWSQYCMAFRRSEWKDAGEFARFEMFLGNRNGRLLSSVTTAVDNWRLAPDDANFGLYFFDDLKTDAAGLRRRILTFLGADPDQPSATVPADFNRKSTLAKLEMSDQVRTRLIEEFAEEIRACAARFGGPAAKWPARYGL